MLPLPGDVVVFRLPLASLFVFVVAVFVTTCRSAHASSLSVDEILSLVERHHPAVAAARARVLAAEAERDQAGAWSNPELGLDAEGIGGDDDRGLEPDEFTLSVAWPLNSLLTRGPRIDVADARVGLARAALQRTSWEIAATARRAVHQAMVADRVVEFAGARMDLAQLTVDAFRAQVEAGESSPIQLLRAEVEHETARSDYESAAADRRIAYRELIALWSPTVDPTVRLSGSLRVDVSIADQDSLAQELQKRHPLLVEARWRRAVEARAGDLVARERWPRIVPRTGIRWRPDVDDQDFVAGLGLELPLFDRRDGARRAAARRSDAAEEDLRELRLDLTTRLRSAVDDLHARARVLDDFDQRIVPRAQDALDRVRIGQRAGKFGALELLDVQRALFVAERARLRAQATYDRTVVEIESLLGRGLDDLAAFDTPSIEEDDR